MVHKLILLSIVALLLLPSLPLTVAHVHGVHEHSSSNGAPSEFLPTNSSSPSTASAPISSALPPQSYFAYPELTGVIFAHVVFMVIAWFFILPIGIMLSVARSHRALVAQFAFLGVHGLGLLLGSIYDSKTPKLYENNSHNVLGWATTVIVLLQCSVGVIKSRATVESHEESSREENCAFIPVSAEAIEQFHSVHGMSTEKKHRYSHDSGQGSEPESSRSQSISSLLEHENSPHRSHHSHDSHRTRTVLTKLYDATDIVILPVGFAMIVSGAVTYGGVFRGSNVFNGLAHTIKGGIFFWFGLLTLGRWMGCMGEYGWAWNVRPPLGMVSSRKARVPSAEFVESFVIFLYGATNVFLEHLTAWGSAWTAQDLEHVSISILFFGGGMCGMLLESRRVQNLLNTTITNLPTPPGLNPTAIDRWNPPKSSSFSMNPFPALIIMLLGLLMSSHHQASMTSAMVHNQWGKLFVGFALARALTYLLTYLSAPTSYLPSRPPTEIVTSFCLISGGIIFMASNKDTIAALEHYELEAMFVFTVTMGFTAFLMAWTIIVLAVKGLATTGRRPPSRFAPKADVA